MIGICRDCILYNHGNCFSEDEPERIIGCITQCDYYKSIGKHQAAYQNGFIDGFIHCNEMKKQPIIERIEKRAKQEVFNKLIEIVKSNNFPEYVEGELIDYLKSEGCEI